MSTTKPTKPVKIAIIAIENNPFFAQVKTGYDAVKPKIEAAGGRVDWINAGTDVTVDRVGDAINAAVVDGYDAIAALMPGAARTDGSTRGTSARSTSRRVHSRNVGLSVVLGAGWAQAAAQRYRQVTAARPNGEGRRGTRSPSVRLCIRANLIRSG